MTETFRHAAVWIDHHEAKIFHVDSEHPDALVVRAPRAHVHRHPIHTSEHEHSGDAKHYYQQVARALEGAAEVLVVGPASAKLEFIKHVHEHERALVAKIIGVETVDHPSDGQLVAYARKYFVTADRMR